MLVLFVLALLLGCSRADLIRSTVTQWIWQTSIVVNDLLYITGGEEYESPSASSILNFLRNETLVVDLTRSWTNQTLTARSSFVSPSDLRTVRQPVLFYDKVYGVVKRYGGWPYLSEEMPSQLWSFPVDTSSPVWTQETSPLSNGLSEGSQGPMSPASTYSDTTFYSLGGNVIRRSILPNQTTLSGIVRRDFATGLWRNDTTDIPDQSIYRNMAKAFHVPNFGDQGFVVFVGGEAPPTEESFYEEGNHMVDMSVITLLDPASGSWYTQTATGDIPPPRVEFCAVGSTSADNSTYEIFVYGGSTNKTLDQIQANDEGYLNVYTLSLPAFEWFKSPSKTPVRRACHTCSVIGNRQMISIGGRFPSSRQSLGFDRDPWVGGIGVFDMTSFAWTDSYNASAQAYDSPVMVKDYYSSTYKVPEWSDADLATIFAFTPPPSKSSNTTDGNEDGTEVGNGGSGSSPGSSIPTGSSSTTNVGAIAGGTVAGVAVVLGLVAGVLIWRRLRQRRRRHPTTVQPGETNQLDKLEGNALLDTSQHPKHELDSPRNPQHSNSHPMDKVTGVPESSPWSELDATPAKQRQRISAVELPAGYHAR